MGDIQTEFPFPKKLVLLTITGQILLQTIEQGLRAVDDGAGYFPLLSKGAELVYDHSQLPGSRIVQMSLNGEPVETNGIYRVVVTEYMYNGGDGFDRLKEGRLIPTKLAQKQVAELVIDSVRAHPSVQAKLEGRIRRL